MAKTKAQLKQVASTIENATTVGENSAARVGRLFNDIIDYAESVGNTNSGGSGSSDNSGNFVGNVFTDAYRDKLEGIEAKAQVNASLEELRNLLGIKGTVNDMFWEFEQWVGNKLSQLESQIKTIDSSIVPSEGKAKTDYEEISTDGKWEALLAEFRTKTPVSTLIDNKAVQEYLKVYYDEANAQWDSNASPLFKRSTYPEIEDFDTIEGLKGTNTSTYELAYDAMMAWLMAMCLSEVMPSSSTTENSSSNNQTVFFKVAYNYNGNGPTVSLYDNYDIHCDPMIARLAAAAIYAKVRGGAITTSGDRITQQMVSNIVGLLGNHTINASDWDGLGYVGIKGALATSVGYVVNSRSIIPNAPGPYNVNYSNKYDLPYQVNDDSVGRGPQDQSLFHTGSVEKKWWANNYKVDVAIDDKVCANYLMAVEGSDTETALNTWNSYSADKRRIMLNAVSAPYATWRFFFGSRKVYLSEVSAGKHTSFKGNVSSYTNSEQEVFSNNNDYFMDNYFFKFEEGTTGTYYTVGGPFSDIESKMFSSRTYGAFGSCFSFFKNVMIIGDNFRYPTYYAEYSRRLRPLNGRTSGSARVDSFGDPRNGIVNGTLSLLFADDNNDWNKFNCIDDWAKDPATSYPSGHASQTMTTALLLGQMYADINIDKLYQYLTAAYQVGTGRAISRHHWYSDIIYGRLHATMALPIINAMTGIKNSYNTVKATLTGTTPSGGGTTTGAGSSSVEYNTGGTGSSSGSGSSSGYINIYVANNSNAPIVVTRVQFAVRGESANNNGVGYARYFTSATVPAGQKVLVLANATVEQADVYNCRNAANTIWTDYNGGNDNVGLLTTNSASLSNVSGLPLGTPFINGMTYTIAYGGGASTATDNSSGSASATGLTVKITNNGGSALSINKQIRFILNDGGTAIRTGRLAMSGGSTTISSNGVPVTFTIALDSESKALADRKLYFADKTYSNADGRNYEADGDTFYSNILLYDNSGNAHNIHVPAMSPSYRFEDNSTININFGDSSSSGDDSGSGSGSTDYNGNVITTVTIVNNSGSAKTFDGKVCFITYGKHPSENYTGYFRFKGTCSGSDFTIPAGGSKTYTVTFANDGSQSPAVGLGMPFAGSSQRGQYQSNNGYYINGSCYTCNDFSTSDTFRQNGSYTMTIPAGTHEWTSN